MKEFLFSRQLMFIVASVAVATLLVLSASLIKKSISRKINKSA